MANIFDPYSQQNVTPATNYLNPDTLNLFQPQAPNPNQGMPVSLDPYAPPPVDTSRQGMMLSPDAPFVGNVPIPDVTPKSTAWLPPAARPMETATLSEPKQPAQPNQPTAANFVFGGSGPKKQGGDDLMNSGLNKFKSGIEAEKNSLKGQADIASARSGAEVDELKAAEKFMNESKAREDVMRKTYSDSLQMQQNKVNDLMSKAADPVDARRWWKSKNGFEKVGAALSIALGSFGDMFMQQGGLRGPGNVALDMIQRQIDQDIEEQKTNLQRNQNQVNNQMNVYSMMRQQFGDDVAAENATRAWYNDQTKNRLGQLAAQSGSQEVQKKAEALMGQLDQKTGEHMMQVGQFMASKAEKSATDAANFVPGLGYATDSNAKKESQDLVGAFNNFNTSMETIARLRSEHGSELWGKYANDMQQESAKARNALRTIWTLGNRPPNEKMEEMMEQIVPKDPSKMGSNKRMLEEIQGATQMIAQDVNSQLGVRVMRAPGQQYIIPQAAPDFAWTEWGKPQARK